MVWGEPPAGTESLAIIMDDPDAPRETWVHWVVYNISPDLRGIDEDFLYNRSRTSSALQGINSWGVIGYGGPCPPVGTTHTYRLFLYALDRILPLGEGATKGELLAAIESHIVGQRLRIGSYGR